MTHFLYGFTCPKCVKKPTGLLSVSNNALFHSSVLLTNESVSSETMSVNLLLENIAANDVHDNGQPSRLFSAVRGRLRQVAASLQAAVRFRHISRRESRPPDWFVDKTNQDEVAENKENRAPTCWGHRIVVNPSLPSHYKVFSPGDYICRKGDVGKEMYIVKRGRLQVVADDGRTVLATLSAGSVFGEVSVLDIAGNRTGNRRTANVRSLGYSDLFCLAKEDLLVALADYPEARATLIERGCQLLRKDGLLDEEAFKKARERQESMTDSIKRLESAVENLQTRLARLLAEFTASQAKLKQRLTRVEHNDRPTRNNESNETLMIPPARKRLRSFEARRCSPAAEARHKTM
ncbi:cyclic nucleotide-gated cation channel subunit a [Holotrichia oblita]|uniref:Cyclic nucleotide-gated cation channel subunit a n=1 Tax=Holotrichia oblita TaxID=644536 RepID=A0ACB9TVZ3_HOLOL|nr:cyclic nucleotide-gated cation channel subunit a [Holotrichia oblita]